MLGSTQVSSCKRPMSRNLLPAILLIVVGTIFLLNNLGYTSVSLGRLISTWWPAILIVVGISLLFGSRQR